MLVPDIAVVFDLDGVEHKLSFRDLPLGWWTDLKQQAGFTPRTLLLALGDADVDAYVALIWLSRRQQRSALTHMMVRDKLTGSVQLEVRDIIRDGRSLLGDEEIPADAEVVDGDPPTSAGS